MASEPSQEFDRVSSPLATGQAGAFFEQHVDAAFLSLLLVRGIPPIFTNSQIVEVSFQTERLGRKTDDVFLRCRTGGNQERRLNCQVKRSFTVSATDEECVDTFRDFLADFSNRARFTREVDAFAIIVRHGTAVILEQFGALIDCARVATSAVDFAQRLSTPGLLNKRSVSYADEIRTIANDANGSPIGDEEFWQFLRHVHVLSFDLNSSTRHTESLIRSMLAQAATGPDPIGSAESTWLRLIELVGREGMPQAGAYTYEDLPGDLRARHVAIPTAHYTALQTLRDRTRTLRRGIRHTVGLAASGFHISRDALVDKVRESLRTTRIVVITGPAGIGKSAVGSEAFEQLQANHFAFAFRAEEFAAAHLDITLQQASLPITAEQLAAALAGQSSKVLLIESVERLLEKSTREAFTDLLGLVRDDPSWQLIMTCRDYSLDTVRSSFLDHVRIPYNVVEIPRLSETELDQAVEAIPILRRPATSSQLQQLFRNPYVLDKAANMSWPEDAPLPVDERAFRQKFLREIVRAEQDAGGGMPQRRMATFAEIALRRARALDAYASTTGLDAAAMESLHQRDLISFAENSHSLAAPAHDVLEDWAILQWMEDRSLTHGTDFAAFIAELGSHPAIRRSYRKWLSELFVCDAHRADGFVRAVLRDSALPRYFSDDSLVAVLRSAAAPEFLARHPGALLADDAELLRRVIHLIRVACTTTPMWWHAGLRMPPLYYVPQGDAWAAVIGLIRANLTSLLPRNASLIVGLLHDWTGIIHAGDPLPAGAGDAFAIAYATLPLFDYRSKQSLERMIRLLSLVPLADEAAYRRLLIEVGNETADGYVEDAVSDHVLGSIEGWTACRDVPDAVVTLAEKVLYLTDEDIRDPHFSPHWSEPAPDFGLKNCGNQEFFPASAFRGPFLGLLLNHPEVGIPFLIRLLNRAVEWRTGRRMGRRRQSDTSWQTTITFSDGTQVLQWCDPQLWQLYRGISRGPYLLQCALMALEHWLLQICNSRPADVEQILIKLLRESNNAAVSAVAASVATAYPEIAGEAAIALLTSSDFVRLDKPRTISEVGAPSRIGAMFPKQFENQVFDDERKKSDDLPHRRWDLEWTAIRLQNTPWREAVERVIDVHKSQLPTTEAQSDDDRIWRIALHRMDLRAYSEEPIRAQESTSDEAPAPAEVPETRKTTRVLMQPKPFEPDIQAMLDRNAPTETAERASMSLFLWGVGVFQRTGPVTAGNEWRVRLAEARDVSEQPDDAESGGTRFRDRGIEFTAAICIRDHWDELSSEEREWCFDTVCYCVSIGADSTDELYTVQRGGMDAARAAALVIPLLLTKDLTAERKAIATEALAIGLSHTVDEVKDYAVTGVRLFLWQTDPGFCRVCAGAIVRAARRLDEQLEIESKRPWKKRKSSQELEKIFAADFHRDIIENRAVTEADLRWDSGEWYARRFGLRALKILEADIDEPLSRAAYANAVGLIASIWNDEDDRNDRDYHWEGDCELQIARYALCLPASDGVALIGPMLDALPDQPKEVASVVQDFVIAADALKRPSAFWPLWQAVADRASQSTWSEGLDARHSERDDLLRKLFLNVAWNEGVRHWDALDDNAFRIIQLFNTLPATAAVLDAFVVFLCSVGSKSLPWAFVPISRRLTSGDPRRMLALPNTNSGLEILFARYVYAVPAFLKSEPELRKAILHILDELVEAGSSRAYRMRDDFVTPAPS